MQEISPSSSLKNSPGFQQNPHGAVNINLVNNNNNNNINNNHNTIIKNDSSGSQLKSSSVISDSPYVPSSSSSVSSTTNVNNDNHDPSVFHGNVNLKIACLACREKKLKCDKLLPVCTRCAKKKIPCVYVEHKKTGPKPNSTTPKVKKPVTSPDPNKNNKPKSLPLEHLLTPTSTNLKSPNKRRPTSDISGDANDLNNKRSKIKNGIDTESSLSTRIPVVNFMNPSTSQQQELISAHNHSNNHYYNDHSTDANTISTLDHNGNSNTISPLPIPNIDSNIPKSLALQLESSNNNGNYNAVNNNRSYSNISNASSGTPNFNKNTHPLRTGLDDSKQKIYNQPFNTSLTNLTNKSFEEVIGLPNLNLTMQDIDNFHSFYFNSNTRIFKYSVQRYYNTFVKDPKSILHYSYMIWTIACFYLDEYEHIVNKMYENALTQMTNYWESNRDSFHSDILTYLHALCLKAQFEFLSGREMRAALTISSSIRLTQMYGYDQIDLSPTTLSTPAIFFRSFSVSSENYGSTNTLIQDDNLDPDIPLVEERRRVLWEVFAIDKWSSLVTGLPCALSVDSLSVIFTKLPSPTSFLPLNNETDISEPEHEQNSYYLHEAMQKLDNNQVLLDINSSSSKILLLTISENIIKWCKMFLNMVELETLKSASSIDSIRNKVDELVRNFESMHNNLLFFDLTTEPLMNIVITNTSTLLYQSVLIKFGSLFDLQFKEDPTGATICENEIKLFRDILDEVSTMSEKLVLRFIKKQHIEIHLKKAPVFIVFINSIKSLFQCIAFVYKFNTILHINEERKQSLLETIQLCATIINGMSVKTPIVEKTKDIINNGQELLDHSPHLLSFFDSFFDSAKTY